MTTDIRRFGYYVPKGEGTVDVVVHRQVVSADALAEFHEISSVILKLQPIMFAFSTVERNYRELIDSIENYRLQLSNSMTASTKPISAVMDGFALATQKISNFLASTSAFLAQTETQLRRVYGIGSPELIAWDEKRKNLHASNFSYRFLYELRNFAQHRAIPFSSFNITGVRTIENASMLFKTGASVLREGFLGDGYDWKKLRVEIQQQPSEFELLPLISEYLHCLRLLCLEVVQLHSVQLAECASYFDVMRRKLKIPVGAVPVIFIGESSKGIPPSRFESIPTEQFEYILREYDKLLNAC